VTSKYCLRCGAGVEPPPGTETPTPADTTAPVEDALPVETTPSEDGGTAELG
jgi:hypothetical protein